MKTLSLIMLAAVGLSLQANAASNGSTLNGAGSSIVNSLTPGGLANADAVTAPYLAAVSPSLGAGSVVAPGTVSGNPIQNFSTLAASSSGLNDTIGTQTIKILPEPTTLALTTLGGLSALVFTRHFRKSRRA